MARPKLLEKTCPYCKITKKRAEFYESHGSSISAYCRPCTMQRAKKEGREIAAKARKRYYSSEKGRAYTKEFMKKNAAKYRAKAKAEGKIKARYMARYYLKKKPCEACGNPKSQAHHHDYSKPLEVTWLCSTHHAEHHHAH